MKMLLLVAVALITILVVITLVFAELFAREVARLEARLAAGPAAPIRADLPVRIQSFARRGLAGGTPGAAVRLTQSCEMRLQKGADWRGLSARQIFALPQPGFAWVASMKIGPIPVVRVIDRYADGEGLLDVRLLGAFRLGAEAGPEAALGEGLRYLAELPWIPDAILTNRAIAWAETAAGATASMETAGGLARVLFSFDDAGDIITMQADARATKLEDGTPANLPWRGRMSDYAEVGGRRIPTHGEVGYVYPDGYEAYWRGTITSYSVVAGLAG